MSGLQADVIVSEASNVDDALKVDIVTFGPLHVLAFLPADELVFAVGGEVAASCYAYLDSGGFVCVDSSSVAFEFLVCLDIRCHELVT